MKAIGYLVVESCEDFEQTLGLKLDKSTPPGGLLVWGSPAVMFQDRKSAKAAIDRTEHYRLAFLRDDLPEKRFCRIKPVVAAPPTPMPSPWSMPATLSSESVEVAYQF